MLAILVALTLASLLSLAPESSAPAEAQVSVALNAVNTYRALANLAAVTENAALSLGAAHHSTYMVENQLAVHDEDPAKPFYTADGDRAGNDGNTFVSWPASAFTDQLPVDFWVAGVFHQGHILDQRLLTVGYGSYTKATAVPDNDYEAGATLNFGDNGNAGFGAANTTYGNGTAKPIMFPGNNKVMPLTTFGGNEFPDPFTSCPGYAAPTGPAISVQIATTPAVTAASLKRNGTDLAFCRIDETNYTNPDAFSQSLGRLVMSNSIDGTATRHMIALIPRNPLTDGTYTVSITSNGTVYAWTFFVGAPPVTRTLTVSKNGTGSGTVSSNPAGIACGADCTETYTDGTAVTLTANSAAGSVFAGWSGACTGTAATCSLTMSADRSVTATFTALRTLTVSKSGTGSGTVSSNPAGVSCGADCSETYNDGTGVTLTAAPAAGSVFAGWSGACTGTATTCTLTMSADRSATATFNTAPPGQKTLTVSKAGTGSGTVSSNPAGISCGADCSEAYNDGTGVTLTANSASGSTFAGWGGACTGTAATCSLTMTANKSVSATFNTNAGPSTYTATAVASPTSIAPGSTVGITANVFSPATRTLVVDIEIYDDVGNQLFQWYWEDQAFTAGQTRQFSTSWQVPAGLPTGPYAIQVGVFSQGWVSELLWNDSAGQVTVAAANPCSPRPRVRVVTSRGGQAGLLQVSVTAGQGTLRTISLGNPTNATITIPAGAGGRAGLTGSGGNTSLTLSDRPATLTFTINRVAAGRATTVPLTLVDDCGSWQTFVGGGPGAF